MSVRVPNQVLKANSAIRLLVVDASRIGAHLLADALQREHFEVTYEGPRIDDATAVADRTDVALLIAATGQQCTEACAFARKLRAASKRMHFILLTEEQGREPIIEAFRAGIRGIFSRTTSLADLRKCILAVQGGQVWASNGEIGWLLDTLSEPPSMRLADALGVELLSKRQQDVVRCASEGLTNREIADQLGLSENTVKNYLFHIFDKLGISSRAELILYAISNLAQQRGERYVTSTPGSDDELFRFVETAAEQLIIPAYSLAQMHQSGRGTPRDPAGAYRWYLIAKEITADARLKSQKAAAAMEKELSRLERFEAQRAAEQWLKERAFSKSEEITGAARDKRCQVEKRSAA